MGLIYRASKMGPELCQPTKYSRGLMGCDNTASSGRFLNKGLQ